MIHGPCEDVDPNAWCMRATGCCWKDFPKAFAATNEWYEDAAHPTYRRRAPDAGGCSGVDARGRSIDNRWVMPCSPYLTLKYGAHINIAVCSSTRAFKYLLFGRDEKKDIASKPGKVFSTNPTLLRYLLLSVDCWQQRFSTTLLPDCLRRSLFVNRYMFFFSLTNCTLRFSFFCYISIFTTQKWRSNVAI